MSKTNDTTKPGELTEAELDTVSGGEFTELHVYKLIDKADPGGGGGDGGGGAGPAINAWNKLLGNYGF